MSIEHADLTSIHKFAYVQNSDPGTVGAEKAWVDTSVNPFLLKVRNAGDTAWNQIGFTAGGGLNVKDYGAVGDGTADDTVAIQAALDAFVASSEKCLYFPFGTYVVNNLAISGLSGKIIDGRFATLKVTTASAVGIHFTNLYDSEVRNLCVVGSGPASLQKGIRTTNSKNSEIINCRFKNLSIGLDPVSNVAQLAGIVSVPLPFFITGCTFESCNKGIVVNSGAEYTTIRHSRFLTSLTSGVEVKAGNVDVINNSFMGNWTAVYYDSNGVANGDHGLIMGNKINHNIACGILLNNLAYSMHVVGNDIWATYGDGGLSGNLGTGDLATSFGVYLFNTVNVNFVGNMVARNKFNMGLNGHCLSNISSNHFLGDGATTNHIKEHGSLNTTYGLNAQNNISNNLFSGGLASSADAIQLLTNGNTVATKMENNIGTDFAAFKYVTGSSNYAIDGRFDNLLINTSYSGTLSISTAVLQLGTSFDLIGAGTENIVFPVGVTVTSQTASAVFSSGTTWTFTSPGSFKLVPDGASSLVIIKS